MIALGPALADRLEALCGIPSPTGEEKPLSDELERWARKGPDQVLRIKNSIIRLPLPEGGGRGEGGNRTRPLIALCGHIDTIPIPAADKGHPPRRQEGKLIATGASDMKSGLAVMLELADRVAAKDRFCDLAIVLYAREEGPYAESELGDVLEQVPDLGHAALAVCMEPTDNALQLGCIGSLHATIELQGKSAHSARPWQGRNAIHRASGLLAELEARPVREAQCDGLTYREALSVTRIEGGTARNVIPDRCTLNVNFRFAPDKSLSRAEEELLGMTQRHGASATVTDRAPSAPPFAMNELVRRLEKTIGTAPEPKQAWTDVARFAQLGIPAVNFGPGAPAQAHQAGEWVELAALERSYRVLDKFFRT